MNKNSSREPVLIRVSNAQGPVLVYSADSGMSVIEKDGLYFKDLAGDGILHDYADWRLPADARAKDLADLLPVEWLAGLMLYSELHALPESLVPINSDSYNGTPYAESGCEPHDISDSQRDFLETNHGRHILVAMVYSPESVVRWNNRIQALAEAAPFGIPVSIGSDPRHSIDHSTEFNMGSGSTADIWPEAIGLAASFDPELVREHAQIVGREYRALGMTSALHPQTDLATEPRWMRLKGGFGVSPKLAEDCVRAYCEGLQTSYGDQEISDGWGYGSVNAMVKHWPGGGTGEGGRDAHFHYGKYAVYPGKAFDTQLIPFTEGAFKIGGGTRRAAAVMPYYTISFDQDAKDGLNVANSFSHYMINDLLRTTYGYDGIVCTDWLVVDDAPKSFGFFGGRCWGMEETTRAQKILRCLMSGVDQLGGENTIDGLMEAYRLGCEAFGEQLMKARMRRSAQRILESLFRIGLFENPYVDLEKSLAVFASPEAIAKGMEAQEKSVVMLKNRGQVLPLAADSGKRPTLYIPKKLYPGGRDWFGHVFPDRYDYPVNLDEIRPFFDVTEDPDQADAALVFMESPDSGSGFDEADAAAGGNGYVPISLQYRPYTASAARECSIAGGDPLDASDNRSYAGKTVRARNESDLDMLLETREKMRDKPVIVSMTMTRVPVLSETEPAADALLVHFGVQTEAILHLISGMSEPSGLLPVQMPADMETVERHCEDVPFDMTCYTDTQGHTYDFAYGMNWDGVIDDVRVNTYR